MRSLAKLLLVALVAVVCVAASAAGGASASEPLFLTESKKALLFTTDSLGVATLRAKSAGVEGTIKCEESKADGFALDKSTLARELHIEFKGKCEQTLGASKGTCTEPIKPVLSYGELGLLNLNNHVLLLVAPEKGTEFVEVKCTNGNTKVSGAVVGEFKLNGRSGGSQYGVSRKNFLLLFKVKGTTQEPEEIELLGSLMKGATLKAEGFLGEKASEEAVQLLLFSGTAEIDGGSPSPASPTLKEKYGAANPGSGNIEPSIAGELVNNSSGNLIENQTDLSIGGRGPGLRVTRVYNSLLAAEVKEAGPWGFGWTGSWDAHLTLNTESGTATVEQENGSAIVFYNSSGKYVSAAWVEAKLVKEGSNYIYTLPDQTKLEFNSEGRLVKETDRDGNAITLTYNAKNQLELATDGDSRKLTFKYTESGLVESVTDPMSHVIKYGYSSGNLLTVTIEGKVRWEFEYDALHLMKKVIDGRKDATTNEFDASHRVIKQTIAGHERKWKYGTEPGTETTITEQNGSETLLHFNAAGEATKVTAASGTSEEAVTESEYNGTYELEKLLDPSLHATKYTYDSEGNKKSETDANNNETKWEYDTTHDVTKETTPGGETTTIKRNADGNPEEVSRTIESKTQKTTYKYNSENQDLLEETNPIEGTTKYTEDAAGDIESETEPDGDKHTWKDNEDSQVTSEVSARGNVEGGKPSEFTTTIERDEQGRPTKITDPLGHLTEDKYDGNGNLETETDGNKHTATFLYNEENLPLATHEADGNTVETEYDAEGEMTSRIDGNGHTWEYKRNKLEEVTSELTPLLKKTTKKYDKAGNLETVEDPEKNTTTYKYDAGNRVTEVKYSTGKPSTVKYEYNKDGAVTKMIDETGETVNKYDEVDRLKESTNGAGETVKYEYNLGDEPTLITYPSGNVVKRVYDKAGRLESVTDWNGKETKFLYNPDGQLTSTTFPTGAESKDEYAYNDADQLSEIKTLKGASTLASLIYGRDKDGQVEHILSKGLPGAETIDSTYDASNQLKKFGANAFEYDKANNPTEIEGLAGYKYNEADQLTESHEGKYTYNELGQRTKLEPKTGEATTYTYDQVGNLTAVKQGTSIEDSYTYDGNNLRQLQDTKGTITHLTWDTAEELPLLLLDETNSYIYGPENTPIEQISETGETSYLHHDQQGSTRLITNTKGENVGAYTYTPYGAVQEHTGTATTPLGYGAQYTNTSTGFIYLKARTYDPKTAQFLTVDPVLESSGEPYAYTQDNPLNGGDPTGEQTQPPPGPPLPPPPPPPLPGPPPPLPGPPLPLPPIQIPAPPNTNPPASYQGLNPPGPPQFRRRANSSERILNPRAALEGVVENRVTISRDTDNAWYARDNLYHHDFRWGADGRWWTRDMDGRWWTLAADGLLYTQDASGAWRSQQYAALVFGDAGRPLPPEQTFEYVPAP